MKYTVSLYQQKKIPICKPGNTWFAFNFLDCSSQKKVSWQYYFYLIVIVHITVFAVLL